MIDKLAKRPFPNPGFSDPKLQKDQGYSDDLNHIIGKINELVEFCNGIIENRISEIDKLEDLLWSKDDPAFKETLHTNRQKINELVDKVNELTDAVNDIRVGIVSLTDILESAGIIKVNPVRKKEVEKLRKELLGE